MPRVPIIPTGQSISLDQLFGVGSVCSEPPPQTSALPHPGTSTVDPEESQAALPQNVMSPDPSELPKGMQLLDSLFQKAGMKPQPSNQSLATDLSEQPVTIHQLLHQQPPTQMPSLQTGVSGPSSQQAHPHPRQRTQSPAKESYKPHSFADGSSNQVNRPTNLHPSRGEHRSSKPNSGLQQSSRRSSGGSSSHVRTDQLPNASNGHGGAHYQHQSTQQHMVPAPVPVETVNAEARHNILSLLGHPAATIPNSAFSGAGPGQMSNPGSHNSGAWTGANGSPDSIRSSGKDVYHAHTRKVGNSGGSDGQYHSTRSQQGSQQPSPQQTSQDNGVSPGRHNHSHHANPMAHPSPSQSNGSPYSSHLTHHSQKVRRPDATPPKPPLPPVPTGAHVPRQSAGQPGTIHGTNAWTYENFPKRALSPLNPASQHHSGHNRAHYAHQTQAPGSYQQPAPGWTAPGHGRKPGSYNSQSSPHTVPHTASPPLINDSSRPSRTNSVKGAAGSSSPTVSMSTKLAADVLDEVLAGALSRMSVGERDGPDDVAMDKKEFVVGILELIKVCVDRLRRNFALSETTYPSRKADDIFCSVWLIVTGCVRLRNWVLFLSEQWGICGYVICSISGTLRRKVSLKSHMDEREGESK